MFERYTEKARRLIFYARYEASEFGASEIDTEHLLLGLLREDRVDLRLFMPQAESGEAVEAQVKARLARLKKSLTSVDLPLSNGAKRVLAYAAEEAERLRHRHIGTEHLALGLLREEKCIAAEVMRSNGADLKQLRKAVLETPPRKLSPEEEVEANARLGRVPRPGQAEGSVPARMHGFEAYSARARRAIFFARYEAMQFGAAQIESEHLLLGLMREGGEFLELFFGSKEGAATVRGEVEANSDVASKGDAKAELPLSNQCKRALAYGAEEAERLGKEQIGVEHLLLGLLREIGCFASQMMLERGADLDWIRVVLAGPEAPPEG